MAYNETLAKRVREALSERKGIGPVEEKKMMGGLTFMVDEKMCMGILKDELMCRIDAAEHDWALEQRGCREMDFTRRPMPGFVLVDPDEGLRDRKDMDFWLDLSLAYNKVAKASKKKKRLRKNGRARKQF